MSSLTAEIISSRFSATAAAARSDDVRGVVGPPRGPHGGRRGRPVRNRLFGSYPSRDEGMISPKGATCRAFRSNLAQRHNLVRAGRPTGDDLLDTNRPGREGLALLRVVTMTVVDGGDAGF